LASTVILGISAFFHDSAAALISTSGEILGAIEEEKFSRIKHDNRFPMLSIKYLLHQNQINSSDISEIVYYENPNLKQKRIFSSFSSTFPRYFSTFNEALKSDAWKKGSIEKLIRKKLNYNGTITFTEHHLSHAASTFFASPYKEAAVLTIDGVGEFTTTLIAHGNLDGITKLSEIHFPNSLGMLYSSFTYYCGFKVNSGEYKLMGLAPYGKPKYVNLIKDNLIEIANDGSYSINQKYFEYEFGRKMINSSFVDLFSRSPRNPNEPLNSFYQDVAASIQVVTNEVVVGLAKQAKKLTGVNDLCLAGGVALNCVSNSVIEEAQIFDNIWIQPAAGDAGGALGAAFMAKSFNSEKIISAKQPEKSPIYSTYLGPAYTNDQLYKFLTDNKLKFIFFEDQNLVQKVAENISQGKIVGWFQGKAEFGPRALGNRSILGDPRNPKMQKLMNLKIKFRESFRPFAPTILSEKTSEWFQYSNGIPYNNDSPYMLKIAYLKENKRNTFKVSNALTNSEEILSQIPAVTHLDYSSRIQTLNRNQNPLFYDLIKNFEHITGVPILINTSFNVRGEPIVLTPQDAWNCFLNTEIDILVLGNYYIEKEFISEYLISVNKEEWLSRYELD
jgi:carbamoyltransferase